MGILPMDFANPPRAIMGKMPMPRCRAQQAAPLQRFARTSPDSSSSPCGFEKTSKPIPRVSRFIGSIERNRCVRASPLDTGRLRRPYSRTRPGFLLHSGGVPWRESVNRLHVRVHFALPPLPDPPPRRGGGDPLSPLPSREGVRGRGRPQSPGSYDTGKESDIYIFSLEIASSILACRRLCVQEAWRLRLPRKRRD